MVSVKGNVSGGIAESIFARIILLNHSHLFFQVVFLELNAFTTRIFSEIMRFYYS